MKQTNLVKKYLKKDFKILVFLSFSLGVLAVSCKQETTTTEQSYISSVSYESILLDDGKSVKISPDDRIYYLVRHAEKDSLPKTDPDLTADGYNRSYRLSDILKSARIDEVYSTIYLRTLMTADSISKSKGLAIKPYDPASLKEFAERIKNIEDQKRFLIVGHSNTTPELANHIHGASVLEQFDEKDYDNLIVIIDGKDRESELLQLKFKP